MTGGFIVNHLWQSSWFALFAGALALMLRRNSPKVRYWVWLSASVKFLVPWVLLVNLGSVVPWPGQRAASIGPPALPDALIQIAEPFSPNPSAVQTPGPMHWGVTALAFLWAAGFIVVAFSRCRNWYGVLGMLRAGTPVKLPIAVPALIIPGAEEPGVVGFLRPVLVLPALLLERLNPRQLEALLAHELSHVRRRDNLFATLHMGVEAIFWFHPLVWWIGSRMVEERELACDEEVLRQGCEPTDYVRGILTVCQHYSEAPLPCVSGVTGADVKKRVRTILRGRPARELNGHKKLALAFAAVAAIAVPVGVGVWDAPAARAQSAAQPAKPGKKLGFEVASIKPAPADADERSLSHKPGARLSTSNATVKQLVLLAYQLMPFQVSGGPEWVESAGFDIEAKPANSKATQEQFRQMIQTLLAERFQLKFHYATKEMPVYVLAVAKNGTKLVEAKDDDSEVSMRNGRGAMTGVKATMAMFAAGLSRPLQRKVVDQTGLTGAYTFELRFAPDQNPARPNVDSAAASIDGPSIFTAIREQLGLTLESGKGPVEMLVIDHAEKPSSN